ncbi:MAG: TolC family protein [Bacteroidales bacterium]|nr:TolC family protein [Bacteroidales bacterium]
MTLKKLLIVIFSFQLLQIATDGYSQETRKINLNLQNVIDIAKDSSLKAFIEKNRYLADYWNYRSYKAEFLPKLNLSARPFSYTRAVREEFNWQDSSYQYIEQQNVNSYFNLSLNQNIPFTGGKVYIDSDIGRLQNFNNGGVQYSSTPIRIGIEQGLFDYNHLRWQKKLEPLEFKRAQRDYIQEREEISEDAVDAFFDLLLAQISLGIEETKYANADTLYKDGQERYKKDSISQEDLYSLRLRKLNAENSLKQTSNRAKRAENDLITFLRLKEDVSIELTVPEEIPQLNIDPSIALEKAQKNNPRTIWHEERRIRAERNVVRAKKSRYHANLDVSFGLNQTNENIEQTYQDLLDQQRVRVSLYIPIVDWGLTQKRYNLARRNQQVTNASVRQSEIRFDQNVRRTIEEFNLQRNIIERAALADTLARKSYDIVQERFLKGEADIVKLNSAEQDKISARKSYIRELEEYWEYIYEIRQLTGYDFVAQEELSVDFDRLIPSNGIDPID